MPLRSLLALLFSLAIIGGLAKLYDWRASNGPQPRAAVAETSQLVSPVHHSWPGCRSIMQAEGDVVVTANGTPANEGAEAVPLIHVSTVPASENIRIYEEHHVTEINDVKPEVESAGETSPPMQISRLSPTYFAVRLTGSFKDWFAFRIKNAAGKIVRIDIVGDASLVRNWSLLNPVYRDTLGDRESNSKSLEASNLFNERAALNGSTLPDTNLQDWHYISDCWNSSNVFSFNHRCISDDVIVAMRPPLTMSQLSKQAELLQHNPDLTVETVGYSVEHQPLCLFRIHDVSDDAIKERPCIFIYAGEHADEHDAMQIAASTIDTLLADSEYSRNLRRDFIWLVAPMLDPDGTLHGIHSGITQNFLTANVSQESIAYANWFQQWVNKGMRLDLIYDLHNVQSSETPHIRCALVEQVGVRGVASSSLNGAIVENASDAGFLAERRPSQRGWSPDRLGGWLSRRFGAITLAYEVNSQATHRHLNLHDDALLGKVLVYTSIDFISGPAWPPLRDAIDNLRQERLEKLRDHPHDKASSNAILAEAYLAESTKPSGSSEGGELMVEQWIR